MNAFQDPRMSVFTNDGVDGYYLKSEEAIEKAIKAGKPQEEIDKLRANMEYVYSFPEIEEAGELKGKKIRRFAVMDPEKVNETSIDFAHVREIKRQNKANLLERFDIDVLETLRNLKNVKDHETDFNKVIAGVGNKNADIMFIGDLCGRVGFNNNICYRNNWL